MRITGVELSSDNANIFSFGTSNISSTDKYLVKTIVGLDADEVHRKFYGFGSYTGSQFYRYGITKREIIIRAVLNPNYSINETISDIRDDLYRSISSSRSGLVNLLFTSGGAAVATISGFITKFEVPYFQQVPELQITINCPDPMLRGYNPVEYESGELETSNPIFVSDSLSTAPHGLSFSVDFTATEPYFSLQDDPTNPEWEFKITPNGGFISGDRLVVSSEYNTKTVYMTRSSVTTPLMDAIDPGSIWPLVFPGGNEFTFNQIGSFNWVSMSYYPAYWGL